ncbi:unnamed protein product [Anisakis simplex]|uniref:Protein roadkill n=1 Tax=Anisakis simplex TaxID=6269 RepID=A0A0M3JVK0_ANISI|nr:unnamed protein product [Anisakis simplex]
MLLLFSARISRWNGELKRQKRSSSSSQAQQHRQQNSTRKAIARGSTATSLVITSQSQQSSSNAPATVKQSTHKRRLNTTLANRANNNKKKSAYNSNSNNNNNTNEDTSTQLQLTSTTTTFNNTNNTSYPVGINRTTGDCISNNINDISSDNHISHISESNTKLVYLNNNSTIASRGGITEWNASINIIPAQEQPANLSSRVQATDGVMVSDLEQMMRMPNQLQQNRCQNYQNQNCQSMPRYLPSAISKNSDKLNNNPQLPVPPTSSTSGAVSFEGAIGVYETTCVSAANDGIRYVLLDVLRF